MLRDFFLATKKRRETATSLLLVHRSTAMSKSLQQADCELLISRQESLSIKSGRHSRCKHVDVLSAGG
jgi:hypothetical protein